MTLDELLKSYDIEQNEAEQIKVWLRMEVAKMVSEADCRHLIYTTFDQSLASGVKNAINRHIFKEWNLD